MPASVKEGLAQDWDTDTSEGSFAVPFVYEGRDADEEITKHPGIPTIGSGRARDGLSYTLERYRIEELTNSNGVVNCIYSRRFTTSVFTADYIRWERSYKKVQLAVPTFVLTKRYYVPVGQQGEAVRYEWVEQGKTIDVERLVLSATVNRIATDFVTRRLILDDMDAADRQIGHLHIIPALGDRRWVFQPPTFRQADALRVEISYVWEADIGSGPVNFAGSDADRARVVAPNTPRKPWHIYQVIPQEELDGLESKPRIEYIDLIPPTVDGVPNPLYDPQGYLTLPGRPF